MNEAKRILMAERIERAVNDKLSRKEIIDNSIYNVAMQELDTFKCDYSLWKNKKNGCDKQGGGK